jgi:hypothetical protein
VQIVFGENWINLGGQVLSGEAMESIIHHRQGREHLHFLENPQCLKKVKVNYYS